MGADGPVRGYVLARADADLVAEGKLTNKPMVFDSAVAARDHAGDLVPDRLVVVELREVEAR